MIMEITAVFMPPSDVMLIFLNFRQISLRMLKMTNVKFSYSHGPNI